MVTAQQFKSAMLIVEQYCHQIEVKEAVSVTTIGCRVRLSPHGIDMQGKRKQKRAGKVVQYLPSQYKGDGTVWIKWDNIKTPDVMHESQIEPSKVK
jgi:hypothetical protein